MNSRFSCMPSTAEVIQFLYIAYISRQCCVKWPENDFITIMNNKVQEVKLDKQHGDTSESRANYGIYLGNHKLPKLSTLTVSFTNVFNMWHLLELVGRKLGCTLNLYFDLTSENHISDFFISEKI